MGPDEIQTGIGLVEAAADVATAWKAALAGDSLAPTDKLYFVDWATMCAVVTAKRYELLRHIRVAPAVSIQALARDLGCDFKRAHGDVMAMEEIGLLARDDAGALSTDLDAIASIIGFAV